MLPMSHLLATASALVVCAGCAGTSTPGGAPGAGGPVPGGDSRAAVVRRVVDGDTLIARVDGRDERVRMLGVDAPESVTPDRPVGCFGPEASARAHALLPKGTRVTLASDPTQGARDRFGRLLSEVSLPGDAVTINERLVAGGYAEVFRGDGRARLQPRLRAAERAARSAHLGMWGACRSGG